MTAIPLLVALSATAGNAAPAAQPPSASVVLIVASNRGAKGSRSPLQYADDDGAKYFEIFSTVAGERNTFLLTELDRDTARLFPKLQERVRSPTRAQLTIAAGELARRSAELKREGRTVRFHFVFAGHGDVDQGRGFLELADGPFTADDLHGLLRTIDASEAHVILDSCNSFFVVNPRKPGGARFATPRDAAEALARRLPNVGVFLSTSSRAEVYEWSELQSGVFSHAVRSGLMGAADANGDGHVSYEELAAFIETAVADIKNPLFRPTVYARGPNGEDARAILDVPGASRVALEIDDTRPVRLAVRDTDGLRWADVYKEAGGALDLWFPASLEGRLEIDRLSPGTSGAGRVVGSFALSAQGGDAVKLSSLAPTGSAVAMRGPGEIFQALFSRPFGPVAFAAYLEERATRDERIPGEGPAAETSVPLATAAVEEQNVSTPWARRRPGYFAVVRAGAVIPWATAGGALDEDSPVDDVPGIAIAAGRELDQLLTGELEAGYFQTSSSDWTFRYPSAGYTSYPVRGASIKLQMMPISLGVRVHLARTTPRPYLRVGAGFAPTQVTIDPPGFNATLRATRQVPFFHAGAGIVLDIRGRFFAGVEGTYFMMRNVAAFDARIRVYGLAASALLGARL